jgi:cytoskeleton protein RodZ
MTDPAGAAAPQSTAGQMLRAAREQRGLHIAVLAASVKVPQRKLEALEADRYEELPDITFARALAQTVCRFLKIDAAPVLARLPQQGGEQAQGLVHVSNGLAAPYRDRPGQREPADHALLRKPMFWATGLVLLAALVLALLPDNLWQRTPEASMPPEPGASAAALPEEAASVPGSMLPASQPEAITQAAPPGAAPMARTAPEAREPASGRTAVLRTTAASWVQVRDASGRMLLSRTVQPDESIDLDGALPLRLIIGNARATELSFRGRRVDLSSATGPDNVARLELK